MKDNLFEKAIHGDIGAMMEAFIALQRGAYTIEEATQLREVANLLYKEWGKAAEALKMHGAHKLEWIRKIDGTGKWHFQDQTSEHQTLCGKSRPEPAERSHELPEGINSYEVLCQNCKNLMWMNRIDKSEIYAVLDKRMRRR